mmetsp:Transcript_109805/g.310336  ORF Transcript_109805/g.310336 Transcript_109805/m.310336 type:complete len:262 (-) Transcript_109805:653-1438(-)
MQLLNQRLQRDLPLYLHLLPVRELWHLRELRLPLRRGLGPEDVHRLQAGGQVDVGVEEPVQRALRLVQPLHQLQELGIHEAANHGSRCRQCWNDPTGCHLHMGSVRGLDVVVCRPKIGGDGQEVNVEIRVVVLLKVMHLAGLQALHIDAHQLALERLDGSGVGLVPFVLLRVDLRVAGRAPGGDREVETEHQLLEGRAAAHVGQAPDEGEAVGGGVEVLQRLGGRALRVPLSLAWPALGSGPERLAGGLLDLVAVVHQIPD